MWARLRTCDKSHAPSTLPRPVVFGSIVVVSTDYRLAPPFVLRLVGLAFAVAGVLVLAVLLVGGVLGWPVGPVGAVVLVALALVLGLAAVLPRVAPVVRMDEEGYTVHWVRGAGVKQGRWKDVEDAVATTVADTRCIVLRRRDGSTTTIPVDILAGQADGFVRDVQQHLNRGHGYRPVR